MTKKSVLKTITVLFFLSLYQSVFAETEWSLQVDWPSSPTGITLDSTSTIAQLVEYFFEWSISIGVILTFGILIYASFQYIVSSGNPQKISKAKSMLSSSFLGLILLFGSLLLISMLNPELAVISDISISRVEGDFDRWDRPLEEDEMCDYGIISYIVRGEDQEGKTLIEEGDVKHIQMDPRSSIACKRKDQMSEETIEVNGEEKIRFIKAREVGESRRPLCSTENNCAQNPDEECGDEIYVDYEEGMFQYCYDLVGTENSVKYISQNAHSQTTSCLAGDELMIDGGGCILNLYETRHTGRCGQKITGTAPTKESFSGSYDKKINCVEIIRYPPPQRMDVTL